MQWKWKACYFAVGLAWYPGSREGSVGKTYVADAPSDCALLAGSGSLVCLTLDAWRVDEQLVLQAEGGGGT